MDAPEGTSTAAPQKAAVDQVFEHWVFMLGKNPRRCALGPERRKVINRALGLYDLETLLLAVEGCSASEFHNGGNDDGRTYTDLELILRDERHIERFAEMGEALRERAAQLRAQQRQADTVPSIAPAVDPAAVAAQREALRKLAASLAGRKTPA
jgi:hypothetical protein